MISRMLQSLHPLLGGHILVAEGALAQRIGLAKILESLGLTCAIVGDGLSAIDQLHENDFDLVLMDEGMAPLDTHQSEYPKIVALSRLVTEPFNAEHFYQALALHLNRPAFDESQIDKLSGLESNGQPLVQELIEDFRKQGGPAIEAIVAAHDASDFAAMKSRAHGLLSPAATLGLAALARLCVEIERAAFAPHILSLKVSELENQYNLALGWLSQFTRSKRAS